MHFPRSAGILLHVSSLPGPHGIGDLGEGADAFVDYLQQAGQRWWQVLPLGPSDDGNPYVAQSSWAGSPFFISLHALVAAGDLRADEVARASSAPSDRVDWGSVARTRASLLPLAAERFFARARGDERARFDAFASAEAGWLEDWALFAAIRRSLDGQPWWLWSRGLALRESSALSDARRALHDSIDAARYVQFRFFEQWGRVRERCASAGIGLLGDLPIYCARDSADVWSARSRFLLDEDANPTVVSGVPPDYFAADGQLWGTPVYDWDANANEGFAWWIGRLRGVLRMANAVRVDHFRAFEKYWAVPAGAETARAGRWMEGPGDLFFEAVRDALPDAPFIAEDLGVITKPVRDLRDRWDLPGMRVLQFAFGEGSASPHLPYHHVRHSVVYTGTHDNDTSVGWYATAPEKERDLFRRLTSSDGSGPHYHMIRTAYASVADLAVIPMQDALGLDASARMNVPGTVMGNWGWRLLPHQIDLGNARWIRGLAETFGRGPDQARQLARGRGELPDEAPDNEPPAS